MILKKILSVGLLLFFLNGSSLFTQGLIPSYIITTGKLPQLAYSSGEDRLGSAKMGYIDTSVVMKVIDTVKNLYKVQFSSQHYGFIEKFYTEPFHDTILSTVLCESWRVKGGDESDSNRVDSVSFSLSGRVPYKSW